MILTTLFFILVFAFDCDIIVYFILPLKSNIKGKRAGMGKHVRYDPPLPVVGAGQRSSPLESRGRQGGGLECNRRMPDSLPRRNN